MSRRIQAPGIEINEYDRSAYDAQKTDNSIVDTVSLVCGWADKGTDYITKWINTKNTFIKEYGYPSNEPEKYFYNAAVEVLDKGGILLTTKLPYDNDAHNTYNAVQYMLSSTTKKPINITDLADLATLDTSLQTYLEFSSNPKCKKISLEELDSYRTNTKFIPNNNLLIVDITRSNYSSTLENTVSAKYTVDGETVIENSNECLGIVPIVTTPMNALYLQNHATLTANVSAYEVVASLSSASPKELGLGSSLSVDMSNVQYATQISSNEHLLDDETLSKDSLSRFPAIQFLDSHTIDKSNLKSIGICVYRAYKDTANNNQVSFEFLESFIGSLDRTSKDQATNASNYIVNVVNQNSKYINVFANFSTSMLKSIDTLLIKDQVARSLGFYKIQLQKKISYDQSIKALNIIFNKLSNKNTVQLDLVVDAGVTTILQLAKNLQTTSSSDVDFTYKYAISEYADKMMFNSKSDVNAWYLVAKKFDDFCKSTRKDCLFLADIYRPFCLNGDEKIVRTTSLENTIEKDIVPKLRYMTGINSSYTAGYSDWFYVQDDYTGDMMWLPPSIKAAGICIYTDAYSHTWDAPAGLNRGIVKNVVDIAFSPSNEEAGKLYMQCWNYAINYPVSGIALEGQKTMQLQKTAFDRINVRRLFLYLEKKIIRVAKYFLYEGNTAYLRQRFVDTIRPLLEDAVAGYGIREYYIKCDDTNNTTQTIDNNELHCQIAIKPIKTIEFIVLDFVCTNQSGDVTETVINS